MAESLLRPEQKQQLEQLLANDPKVAIQRRARLLLLYDQGQPTRQVAQAVGISRGRARYWRRCFRANGMGIFGTALVEPQAQAASEAAVLSERASADVVESQTQPSLPKLKSPGVLADDPLAEAGRKVLRFHFIQMLSHEQGTRLGEDIEELHDMRVATRRMRAAFEIFENVFTRKAVRAHLKGLRATGRALGRVRDLDVFMEKAHRYQKNLPQPHRDGLQPLLRAWEQAREAARQNLLAYLDSQEYRDFVARFEEFVNTPGAGVRAIPAGAPHLVRDLAPSLIYERYAAVRAYDNLLDTATLAQFHALRIEFKRLRYTLEFFREVLGNEAGEVIETIKGLQDHLGDLNDAHVATQLLRDFLAEWDDLQDKLPVAERQPPQPILEYLAYRYEERQRLMRSFRDAWERFNRPDVRQNLALAVSAL